MTWALSGEQALARLAMRARPSVMARRGRSPLRASWRRAARAPAIARRRDSWSFVRGGGLDDLRESAGTRRAAKIRPDGLSYRQRPSSTSQAGGLVGAACLRDLGERRREQVVERRVGLRDRVVRDAAQRGLGKHVFEERIGHGSDRRLGSFRPIRRQTKPRAAVLKLVSLVSMVTSCSRPTSTWLPHDRLRANSRPDRRGRERSSRCACSAGRVRVVARAHGGRGRRRSGDRVRPRGTAPRSRCSTCACPAVAPRLRAASSTCRRTPVCSRSPAFTTGQWSWRCSRPVPTAISSRATQSR